MTNTEQCPAGCDHGFLPCPHTNIDDSGWCTDCDTPADEPNPTMNCPECF